MADPRRSQEQSSLATAPTGTLTGTARYAGSVIPTSTIVPVGTDPQHCGSEKSKEDCEIDPSTRGIRYAIARLKDKRLNGWPATPKRLLLDNKNCRFEPHAAVLTVGSVIELKNSDPIAHTVHAYFGESFNVLLAPQAAGICRTVTRPGLIQLRCDLHGWMNAFVQIDAHPFHAVTGADGRFTIEAIPVGTYTLELWHERLGKQKASVLVEAGRTTDVTMTFSDQ